MESNSPVKPRHFFKIVTFSNVEHNKLRIPRKFIESYGNNIGDLVLLNVPSGAVWRVELNDSNGHVWLCNGWKQFADYYSIRPGHLVVFKYKGYSNFEVIIFDMSASEIEYPFDPDHVGQSIPIINLKASAKEQIQDDGSVQVLENFSANDNFKSIREVKEESFKGPSSITRGKLGALQSARAFKTGKPSFIVRMGPSYVSGKSYLRIPKAFATSHLGKKCSCIVLQASCGRTWPTRCIFEKRTETCGLVVKMFTRDNNLKAGDVCHFEMIDDVEPRLNVSIFREFE